MGQLIYWSLLLLSYATMFYFFSKSVSKTIDNYLNVFENSIDNKKEKITREDLEKINFIETQECNERFLKELSHVPYENLSEDLQKWHDELVEDVNKNYQKCQEYKSQIGEKQYIVRYSSWQKENKLLLQ